MTKTKTFGDYVRFLEELKVLDPLFLFHGPHSLVSQERTALQEEARIIVPEANMALLLGGDQELLSSVFFRSGLTVEEEMVVSRNREGGRYCPYLPRTMRRWNLSNDLCHAVATFEHGRAKEVEIGKVDTYTGNDSELYLQFYQMNLALGNLPGGSIDVSINLNLTNFQSGQELEAQYDALIREYDLKQRVDFEGIKTSLGAYLDRIGKQRILATRASVEMIVPILNVLCEYEISSLYFQGNQSALIASNNVALR